MDNFMLEKATYYYYGMLNNTEKKLYEKLLHAIVNQKQEMDIAERVTVAQLNKVSDYIVNDRPDLFWYRGAYTYYTRNNVPERIKFRFIYTRAQVASLIGKMESSRFYRELTRGLASKSNQFEMALFLYEYIIRHTEYESRALNTKSSAYEYAYGLEGVILQNRAVCSGYSRAFQYFASKFHIICTTVTGKTLRDRHAWNLIKLGGSYYYIDATWGDPIFSGGKAKDPNYVSYDYFCITTAQLKESHRPVFDDKMPVCTDTRCNYYEYFNLIDSSYTLQGVVTRIVYAAREGKKEAVIKYRSAAAYNTAVTRLFKSSEIFEALRQASRYVSGLVTNKTNYTLQDESRIIKIKLK